MIMLEYAYLILNFIMLVFMYLQVKLHRKPHLEAIYYKTISINSINSQ